MSRIFKLDRATFLQIFYIILKGKFTYETNIKKQHKKGEKKTSGN